MRGQTLSRLRIAVPALLGAVLAVHVAAGVEQTTPMQQRVVTEGIVHCRFADKLLGADDGFLYLEYDSIEQFLNGTPSVREANNNGYVTHVYPDPDAGYRVFATVIPYDKVDLPLLHSIPEPACGRLFTDRAVTVGYGGFVSILDYSTQQVTQVKLDILKHPIVRLDNGCKWADSDEPVGYMDWMIDILSNPSDRWSVLLSVEANGICKIMEIDDRLVIYNWARDILYALDDAGVHEVILEEALRPLIPALTDAMEIREGAVADDGHYIYIGVSAKGQFADELELWRFTFASGAAVDSAQRVGVITDVYLPVFMEVFDDYVVIRSMGDHDDVVYGPLSAVAPD